MWYLLLFAIVDVASASLTPKLYTKVFDGECVGDTESELGSKTRDQCHTECMGAGYHSFVHGSSDCKCERGTAWAAFDFNTRRGHEYPQKYIPYRCGDGSKVVQTGWDSYTTESYGTEFTAYANYAKYQAYCPAGKYHYSMTHCEQCPDGKYRPDEWRVTDGACTGTSCMLITESGPNGAGTGVCAGECDGGTHPYGSSTTLQCDFTHDNSATIHCFQKGEAATASQAPIPGCAHVGVNIGWDYCYDTALPEGNFDAHQCHDCPYGYGPSADQKSCVVLPVPGYTYVRQGLCVNGIANDRVYNLGIRTYEGVVDNPGTDKLDVCAKSCKYQKPPSLTAPSYGPWKADDPATGFGMSSTGRCYCNHVKHGDLSTCSVDHTVYNMYRFDVEAGCSPGQEPAGDSCTDCVAGKYSSDGDACASCPTGFKSKDDHTACETCPGGYEPSSDRSSCDTCAAGKYSSDGDACASCPTGFKSKDDHTACETCPGGSIISLDQSSCETCDPGKVTNADGTGCQCSEGHGGSSCATCEAGQFSSGGADCALCEAGYQDQAGQPSCKDCVEGYTNDENTTCTTCPFYGVKYDWSSGCPDWSTDDECFCNCTGSGFTGEHCDICAKGMGWNGVLGADAKCVNCSFPTVNDQTSHSAVCSHDFCPPGSGTTSDEAAWLADNSTTENCVACAGNTVSPSYYGQCTEVMCNAYSTVKDTIDHTLNNTNQTNCEPCSWYNVGASCSPIACTSGRMKIPHDGSAATDSYIDYGLEPNNQDNCIPCGVDEVVSADGTSCVRVVCPDGFKILVEDPTLAYNDQTNCVQCEGITYAKGTKCIDFDCGSNRVMGNFVRTEEASKCGEQCTGDTILDVNDLTQCVACEGDTVVNSDHTGCVTSVCRVGYMVNITDRSLTPGDYHQDANCEEMDECLTASCNPCGDIVNGYVCTEEIELRQGIEAFANANEHVCPSGFRLSSKAPVNAADIGLREGTCPPLKVFAERFSIHEGVFRSKLVENTASVVVEGKACKYTYEDLISL